MTRVAVTGGSGKLGRAVVRDLTAQGSDVVVLDRVVPPADVAVPGVAYVRVDLGDYGQVVGALTGVEDRYDTVDAVVHLAAIPAPGLTANAATFTHNITATWHVFTAARVAGIRRIVWASSETVLGLPFATPPPYAPVDEDVTAPESSYSLAKHLEEQLAFQLCRWEPELTMTGLRFSNVMAPEDYAAFPSYQDDARLRSWNLWAYIDARDGAQAVRRSLEREGPGCEVCVIANADTVMHRTSAELLGEVFPEVPVRRELAPHETLLSIDKARRLLGYEPEHSWRTELGAR
jgi:UDP-glucose 4-epimerase